MTDYNHGHVPVSIAQHEKGEFGMVLPTIMNLAEVSQYRTIDEVFRETERGPVPGNGAQLAALETATRLSPVVVGKPEPEMYREAMRRMAASPDTTAVLGDRLDTDIEGGVRLGLTSLLVLSGIATATMLADSPVKPDLVFAGLPELTAAWQAALRTG